MRVDGVWKWFQHCSDVELLCRKQDGKFVQPFPGVLAAERIDIAFWRGDFAFLRGSSPIGVDWQVEGRIRIIPV
jgi:hypothetical protein